MRLLAIVALAVCVAISWIPEAAATDGLIHGCVTNNKGMLRVVSDPSGCKSNETPLSWNQAGQQGEPGPQGEPGMDGEPGSDAAVLRVFDRDGTDLGLFVGYVVEEIRRPNNSYRVLLEDSEVIVYLDFQSGDLRARFHGIFFEEPACQGIAYVLQDGTGFRVPPGELFSNDEPHAQERYFVGERGVHI